MFFDFSFIHYIIRRKSKTIVKIDVFATIIKKSPKRCKNATPEAGGTDLGHLFLYTEANKVLLGGVYTNREYLPGDVRDRIQDLSKETGISQNEIAQLTGISQGAFSRFMSGFTDKLSCEHVVRIAELFGVSTDFLLGVVNNPTRINYDVTKLGLTVEAAKRLYHEDLNADVVNLLLANEEFAQTTFLIKHYLDNTSARGYASANTMAEVLADAFEKRFADMPNDAVRKTARDLRHMAVPMYQENLYIQKETEEELHAALDAIPLRNSRYLEYRFGFDDYEEHSKKDAARYFHLSLNRGEKLEKISLSMMREMANTSTIFTPPRISACSAVIDAWRLV